MKRFSNTPIGYVIRFLIVVLWCVFFLTQCTPENMEKISSRICKHENVRYVYSLRSSVTDGYRGYKKHYCKDCDVYCGMTYLHSGSNDYAYLDVIREQIDVDELVDGEYYTMTAIVTLANYGTNTRISCKVVNEDITVGFSVDFKEEFEDRISHSVLREGEEITFYGKFDGISCAWMDCELIG